MINLGRLLGPLDVARVLLAGARDARVVDDRRRFAEDVRELARGGGGVDSAANSGRSSSGVESSARMSGAASSASTRVTLTRWSVVW